MLDVACGTGVISRLAAERVGATGSVTGIDIAVDMIEVARAVPALGGATIDLRVADAASLPIPDASVDVVLCQMGLMFMENRAPRSPRCTGCWCHRGGSWSTRPVGYNRSSS